MTARAQIIVQAVNFAGSQGVASEPIIFTMPPVAKSLATEPVVETSHREVATANGSNGHANGSRLPALT